MTISAAFFWLKAKKKGRQPQEVVHGAGGGERVDHKVFTAILSSVIYSHDLPFCEGAFVRKKGQTLLKTKNKISASPESSISGV